MRSLDDPLRDKDPDPVLRLDEDRDKVVGVSLAEEDNFGSSTVSSDSAVTDTSSDRDGVGTSPTGDDTSIDVVHCDDAGSFSLDGDVALAFRNPFNPLPAE